MEAVIQSQERPHNEARDHHQLLQDRRQFATMVRRYKQLAWSSTAKDQQERSSMNRTLMKLYCALNPGSTYAWYDDFDLVMRNTRRV